ncbi:MAG: prolyl oligopeptidase family serine peptidase [Acidothermus cellulolyticus]|nr:prolyl oligopeptidase family serine peptidase [Acidothermus cellulolyticus]
MASIDPARSATVPLSYPPSRRLDLVEVLPAANPTHPVADPYRWLENADDPEVRAWIDAQHALCRRYLDALPGRDWLRRRLTELLGAGVVSAPAWRRGRQFFLRRQADQEHAVLFTVDPDGTERVLLDPTAIDPTGRTTLDTWQPSKEGRFLAYQLSTGGDEESVLRVMDVETGEIVDGPIDRCRYSPVGWLPGGAAFYYVRRLPPGDVPPDETAFHRRVWLHRLGTSAEDDVLIFGDGMDKTTFFSASVSLDGRWLIVSASPGTAPRNDVWIADLSDGDPAAPVFRPVQVDVDAQLAVHIGRDGRAYLYTDRDAPRGRLAVADPAELPAEKWRDLLPEDPEAVLVDYAILDGPQLDRPVLVAAWTRHALSELSVHDLETGERLGAVTLPGLGTVTGLSEQPEGGHQCWFGYTDYATPPSVFCFDALTNATTVWARPPGQAPVPPVQTTQVVYESRDGTPVRMMLIAPPVEPARPRPTILTGYGGFGTSLTPGYSAGILAWVEAGGVYAVANLRGGGEEGEQWHRAGMRGNKQNVFDDFRAAADWLIANGWTTPGQLGISGGSNGGLLVGAAMTQAPEKYAAVVCSAPLLDMVRYEKFGLGPLWREEYGTAEDPEELAVLLAYSPYHNVRPGTPYPAVLFTVFDSDTRVDPMHARKMCAALQAASTSGKPVLLRRESDVGHGARALSRSIELSVDTLAFLAAHTGLDLEQPDRIAEQPDRTAGR